MVPLHLARSPTKMFGQLKWHRITRKSSGITQDCFAEPFQAGEGGLWWCEKIVVSLTRLSETRSALLCKGSVLETLTGPSTWDNVLNSSKICSTFKFQFGGTFEILAWYSQIGCPLWGRASYFFVKFKEFLFFCVHCNPGDQNGQSVNWGTKVFTNSKFCHHFRDWCRISSYRCNPFPYWHS